MRYNRYLRRKAAAIIALLLICGLAGCQTGALSFQGREVRPENRILFPVEGTGTGSWQTRDMTIEYQLITKGNGIHLTGTLFWANHIRFNYNNMRISLRANFFDDQNMITGGQAIPLIGFWRLEETLQLDVLLNTSPTDKGLAFSYSGRASDGGTNRRGKGDAIDFSIWHVP